MFHLLPPCPFHTLTGLECPLCGGTRALLHMARGDWVAAWDANPVVVLATLALPVVLSARASSMLPITPGPRARRIYSWAAGAAVIAFTVARNL